MYPPRSSNRQKNRHRSKRRRRTVWAWINVSMLLLISAMLTYYFIGNNGQNNVASPPPSEAVATPSPEGGTTEPEASASFSPEPVATPEPSPSASPEASPSPEITAEASPSAEASKSPEPARSGESQAEGGSGDSGKASGLPENNGGNTVKLSFAGDVIFAGKVGDLLQKKGYDYSYAALDGMFRKDDLTVVNLETPITTAGVGAENKQFVFKGDPKALDALKSAGIDAVNLANNHTLDQGESGLLDTLNYLRQRGVPYVGAGADSKEAYSAQYFERQGIRIALLGFTRVMPEKEWMAGEKKPGVASVYNSREGLKAIAAAKKKADLVIVIVHWGKERVEQYDTLQQELGHSFIDAGADLVMGGHPHVLQGIEPYKGKWIAYSTGNFIFTRSKTPATWETAVFQAECSVKGECDLKLSPMDAELGQPVPMNEADGQLLLNKVEGLSSGLVKIRNDGTVVQAGK